MKVNMCAILLIALCATAAAGPVKLTSRTLLRKRLDKYFYFTTSGVESQLNAIDKMDQNQLNEVLSFDQEPEDIDFSSGDQVCVSNTFFSLLFTILTFSSACSVIVACQILNDIEKKNNTAGQAASADGKKDSQPSLLSTGESDSVEMTEKSASGGL